MIEYLKGTLEEIDPTRIVLDCGGIGYDVNVSLIDSAKLNGFPKNEIIKLYMHEIIREDTHELYGFLTKKSRELFRLLIGVSGVGPNTARLILSSLTEEQLQESISNGREDSLKAVKGIGGKTAQRIIIDLKDKIKPIELSLNLSTRMDGEAYEDSIAALAMLGFSSTQSQKVLKKIFSSDPGLSAEKAIKLALKML